jgi:hypothetical protein
MTFYGPIVCLLLCVPVPSPSPLAKQEQVDHGEFAFLKHAPEIYGDTYQCGEIVQTVNQLRKLGKEKCLTALRKYVVSAENNETVLIVCRLMFVNPKGWEPPHLGSSNPKINAKVAKQFPLFPIAISNGVPFLLIRGYDIGGVPEQATKCLKLCEGLSLIEKDYPLTGYEKAARDLVQMDAFRLLYEPRYDAENSRGMARMIMHQATAK